MSWLSTSFCSFVRVLQAANISCCSVVSSTKSPSAKNSASVIPNPTQMLSNVATDGTVLRLKMFATVDCERPDAIASRYSRQPRSCISSRIPAFAFVFPPPLYKYCNVQSKGKIEGRYIAIAPLLRYNKRGYIYAKEKRRDASCKYTLVGSWQSFLPVFCLENGRKSKR